MFSSRNIHFAILGIILGATTGYVVAFYQAAAAAPAPAPVSTAADQPGGMPANHPDVTEEQMMAALKKAAEDSPTEPGVLSRYANELFNAGRLDESAEWYAKVVALDPKNADVRSIYGVVLWRMGKKSEARTQFQTVLTQDPGNVASLHGSIIVALDSHDKAKAEEYVRRIEKSDPSYRFLPDLKKKVAQDSGKTEK